MRIIAGTHQRRIIKPPSNLPVRPTTDLAKEALFNILNNRVDFDGLKVIDLFAGTGNISFEFASRGAAEVIAVESNFKCVDFINKTIVAQSFDNIKVVRADVFRFLSYCRPGFDIIFADPPYDLKETSSLPEIVFEKELLSELGLLIIEHPATINFKNFHSFVEERKYGRVHFSFLQQSASKK